MIKYGHNKIIKSRDLLVFKPVTAFFLPFLDSCPPNKRNVLIRLYFLFYRNGEHLFLFFVLILFKFLFQEICTW